MIWLLMGILVLAGLLFTCAPLYRKQAPSIKASSEVDDYKAEISELDARIAAGGDDVVELEKTKTELQRQLIKRGGAKDTDTGPSAILLSSLFVGVSFAVLGLYTTLGRPELTLSGALQKPVLSANQAAIQNGQPEHENNMSLAQLVGQLEEKLETDASNPDGWMLYARSLMTLKRFDEAIAAYERVLVLTENNPSVAEELQSARAFAAQSQNEPQLPQSAPNAPGPNAADMQAAAGMSAGDRQEMIQGMVDGLSAKLADNPNDPDAWVRLLRARKVLGQASAANAEIDRMRVVFDEDPAIVDRILQVTGWAPEE